MLRNTSYICYTTYILTAFKVKLQETPVIKTALDIEKSFRFNKNSL